MADKFEELPDVLFAQVDTAEVEASVIAMYEGITNTVLYPGDPVRLFLSTLAAVIAQQNAITDYTAKQNLLRYATGNYLDHLGAFLDVWRLGEFPAKTVLKFTLSAARQAATAIPAGTRATADGKIFFATDSVLLIPAGSLEGTAAATCLTYGSEGNGFIIGQIKLLVDTGGDRGFVSKVENTEPATGGSDIETDEFLRNRIRMAPDSFTTAGSENAYAFWALTAHGNIGDVSVVSPVPGAVNIFVMLKGGGAPDAGGAEINAVLEILNDKKRRPLTDLVTAYPINHEPVDYSLKWFITDSQATMFNETSRRIEEAAAEYEAWQAEKAGRDIVPDRLIKLCQAAGAKRIELEGLHFTKIDKSSVANFIPNADRIQFGGVESE